MAEILEAEQLLSNEYEPKRKFRFYLNIDGIDAFTGKMAARPKPKHDVTVIDFINQKSKYAGKGDWDPISIELNDPISPSAAQKVDAWLRLIHDWSVGRMGYKAMYAKDLSIKLLDPMGAVVEKWNGKRCWPSDIDFGDLDYSSSDVVTVKFTLVADSWSLEF